MEGVLLAAVVVLTAVVLVDLALTLAIVRRLRQQADQPTTFVDPHLQRLVGQAVPEVSATATDGTAVTAQLLRGGTTFVAFVATGCGACHDDLPRLRDHLAQLRSGGMGTLVVVDGDVDDELVTALTGVAPVVVEPDGDGRRPLLGGLGIDAYPTYLALDRGTVLQVHPSMSMVPAPAPAPAVPVA
jgi:hypothetical protein